MTDWPDVALVVTVRERYSLTERSLRNLHEHTPERFSLIYVDVNSPRPVAQYLQRAAQEKGFTLIRVEGYVSPNEARNVGLEAATGKYIVFLDNDVLFEDGWLTELVRCAEEENAGLVGPLYLQGELDEGVVHMAGGHMTFTDGDWGTREFTQVQRHFLDKLSDVPAEDLTRTRCDLVEFHCALVRREVFDSVGGMDEQLLTTREHLDFCLRAIEAGYSVYFEPASVMTYLTPPPFQLRDLPYFLLRWSDGWTRETLAHFAEKHGIAPSYVQRMAKTRKRRQHLVFTWLDDRLRPYLGRPVTAGVRRLLTGVEPAVNRLVVKVCTPRRPAPHRVVVDASVKVGS